MYLSTWVVLEHPLLFFQGQLAVQDVKGGPAEGRAVIFLKDLDRPLCLRRVRQKGQNPAPLPAGLGLHDLPNLLCDGPDVVRLQAQDDGRIDGLNGVDLSPHVDYVDAELLKVPGNGVCNLLNSRHIFSLE